MELRSRRRQCELTELQLILSGMGIYENGMDLQEMRQLANAIELSVTDNANHMLSTVQETEFALEGRERIVNSTMVGCPERHIDYSSSPESRIEKILVKADVHNAFEDSPRCCSKDYFRRHHQDKYNNTNTNENNSSLYDEAAMEDNLDGDMIMGPVSFIDDSNHRANFTDSILDDSGKKRNGTVCSTSSVVVSDPHDSDDNNEQNSEY